MAIEHVQSDAAGKVWKVLASPGTEVAPEEPILLIECMKMEIPVVSQRGGRVTAVLVQEGDNVTEGQRVVTLER